MDPFAPAAQLVIVALALNPDGIDDETDPITAFADDMERAYEAQREATLDRIALHLGLG